MLKTIRRILTTYMYTDHALWDRDECVRFCNQQIKGQGIGRIIYAGNSTFTAFLNTKGGHEAIIRGARVNEVKCIYALCIVFLLFSLTFSLTTLAGLAQLQFIPQLEMQVGLCKVILPTSIIFSCVFRV